MCHKGTILKEKRPGKWVCTFGGKANQSESPDETAIRELYEEYELKVDKRNIFLGIAIFLNSPINYILIEYVLF
ncbi:MAG: NUDIX domain-containing protein [Bacteroidetes bacterium]|nr:NUDIX domain-containing protein [Bacteroidota bacterium]